MVGTNNLAISVKFYDELLQTIGLNKVEEYEREIGYAPSSRIVEFWVCTPYNKKPATIGNGSMVAFKVENIEIVDLFHSTALRLGAKNEGNPGARPQNGDTYYAYCRDLDGNKLCAYSFLKK
mgnify:CR=1 FL=1